MLSLQQPAGPEGEMELGELLPDDAQSPYEQVESSLLGDEVRELLATRIEELALRRPRARPRVVVASAA